MESRTIDYSICLVIIFNHKFDKNISVLREVYKERFSLIRFLVPFYNGNDSDVISVYENSYLFQGYISQAVTRLKEEQADYYFFISDDLILNPIINEKNFITEMELNGQALISDFCELGKTPWIMERLSSAISLFSDRNDVNFEDEIYKPEIAFKIARGKGFKDFAVKKRFRNSEISYWLKNSSIKQIINWLTIKKIPYPLVYGYSDWFVLPYNELDIVARKLGVFAAMGLFVEIAIPTTICLYCNRFRFLSETEYVGGQMWDENEIEEFNLKYSYDLNKLLNDFPNEKLYVHPVKLSKWSYEANK